MMTIFYSIVASGDAQGREQARGRAVERLHRGRVPQGAGQVHEGDRRPDHQDEARRRHRRPPHHRQGAQFLSGLTGPNWIS